MIEPTLSPVQKLPADLASYHGEFRAVQNGDVYQIVYTNADGQINCITSKNMQKFLRSNPTNVAKLKNWQRETIVKDPDEAFIKFTSTKRLGVVVISGSIVVFWIDTADNTLCASTFTPGTERKADNWCAVFAKSGSDQPAAKVTVPSGGVSATLRDDGGVLISYLEQIDPPANSTNSKPTYVIRHINLSLSSWDAESNEWPSDGPLWSQPVPPDLTNSYRGSKTIQDFDVRVIAAAVPADDLGNTRLNYLFAALWLPDYAPDGQRARINNQPLVATFAYCVKGTFDGASPGRNPVIIQWAGPANNYRGDGIFVAIDPVGRLVCSFADRAISGRLAIGVVEDLKPLRDSATTSLTWSTRAVKFDDNTDDDIKDSDGLVSMVFTTNSYGVDPPTTPDQTYPLLLNLVWPRVTSDPDAPVMMATLRYANLKTSTTIHPPTSFSDRSKNFLTTVCDPFPMPVPAKLIATEVPSGMADWLLFEYQLLSGESHVFIEDMSWRLGATFQFDFKGPKDEGFQGGAGFSLGGGITIDRQSKVTKYETRGFTVQSKAFATPYRNYDNFRYHDAPFLIRPYGAYSARALFFLKQFIFTTSSLAYATNDAPMVTSTYGTAIDPGNDDTVVGDFFTYTSIPGDLSTYTKEAIDAQMQDLFCALDPSAQAEFVDENGNDLKYLYDRDKSYVDQVRAAFGTQLTIDNTEYIPFALSGSSVADGSYTLSSSKSEGFGGYLDASLYGVIGAGYGNEAGWCAKLTFNFNFTRNVTTTQETSYNIGMKTYINPLASTQSMSVRLYRLKKSRLWALELKHFPAIARQWYLDHLRKSSNDAIVIPDNTEPVPDDLIDTISAADSLLFNQSAPNRVMFVVTRWLPGSTTQETTSTQTTSNQTRSTPETNFTSLNLPLQDPESVVIASADDTNVILEMGRSTTDGNPSNAVHGAVDTGPNRSRFTLVPTTTGGGFPVVQVKSESNGQYLHVSKDANNVFYVDFSSNPNDERTQWYLEASPDDPAKYSLRHHVTKVYMILDGTGRFWLESVSEDTCTAPSSWPPPSSWLRLLDVQTPSPAT